MANSNYDGRQILAGIGAKPGDRVAFGVARRSATVVGALLVAGRPYLKLRFDDTPTKVAAVSPHRIWRLVVPEVTRA